MNENEKKNYWPCPQNFCPVILSIATSIAHEEDALACILNAECEKINEILRNYSDIDNLIAIDSSVQAMLEAITNLEGILKAKLDAILPLLNNCN